ncbi:hypothetical protein ACFX2J_038552 [Malus domestica]
MPTKIQPYVSKRMVSSMFHLSFKELMRVNNFAVIVMQVDSSSNDRHVGRMNVHVLYFFP